MKSSKSRIACIVATTALAMSLAAPAAAHVGIIDGTEVVGGGHGAVITLRVPHGCDGAPTDAIEVRIPEGVTSVQPRWMAGWTIETTSRTPAASVAPGSSAVPGASAAPDATEVDVVRWSGAHVPDDQFVDLQFMAVFPTTPGDLYFPIVQRCGSDEIAWIEVPEAGQTEDDLERPAGVVTVVQGEADDH